MVTSKRVFDEQMLHFLWYFDRQNRHNANGFLFLWTLSVSRFVILKEVFFGGNRLIKGILFFNRGSSGGNLFIDKYFGGKGGGGCCDCLFNTL